MSDDPVMQMYEAQAIAVEQQMEINRLKREKEELEERLRRVDLGREGRSAESSSPKFNDVWTAINDLKQQYTDVNNIQEEIRVDLNSLKETNRIDIANMQQQMEERLKIRDSLSRAFTCHMLAQAAPQEQKQLLGELIYALIAKMYPGMKEAGKITGMMLEIDNSALVMMLQDNDLFRSKVEEASAVLQQSAPKNA